MKTFLPSKGGKKNGSPAVRLLMLSLLKLPVETKKRLTEYRLYKKKTFTSFILPLKTLALQHICTKCMAPMYQCSYFAFHRKHIQAGTL